MAISSSHLESAIRWSTCTAPATSFPGLKRPWRAGPVGDSFEVVIPPEQAYGLRSDDKVQRIAAKYFRNASKLQPGQVTILQTKQGPAQVTVLKVGRFNIDVDANHPLAGQQLTFDVEIVDIRDATGEEVEHGHVHGPGGVEH